jgi:hypothetical protein
MHGEERINIKIFSRWDYVHLVEMSKKFMDANLPDIQACGYNQPGWGV